jgi:polar amino acid transport system substrate-binding protein
LSEKRDILPVCAIERGKHDLCGLASVLAALIRCATQKTKQGTSMISALKLAAAVAMFGLASGAYAADKIKIGTEGAYPPFNSVTADGKVIGFDIDIANALCEHMKVECEIVTQDWDGIIPGLVAKKYDAIIASMSITEERRKTVAFTDPYYKAALTFVAKKGSGVKEIDAGALKGKTIGAQSGTTQADYVTAAFPDAELKSYPTQDEVNLDLVSGRIDFGVSDLLPMLDWVSKSPDGACCELVGAPVTDAKYAGEGAGIAIRQDDKALIEAFNKALAEIRADGTYKAINDKYFTIDIFTMK